MVSTALQEEASRRGQDYSSRRCRRDLLAIDTPTAAKPSLSFRRRARLLFGVTPSAMAAVATLDRPEERGSVAASTELVARRRCPVIA